MLTPNDVHAFIIDTDNWKEGSGFTKIKYYHRNCTTHQTNVC